jgi:hypothetical protein
MSSISNLLFSAIILAFTISACKKPDDVKPEITIEFPLQNLAFPQGGEILFKAACADDKALSSYKIDIHGASDGHVHKTQANIEWKEIFIGEISGTKELVERKIAIPELAKTGPYHFSVFCIDAAGNESILKEINFSVLLK